MRIFYGWFIVAASVLMLGYHSTMFVYGLTAFFTPIAASTGGYYPIWYIYAGLTALGTLAMLLLPKPALEKYDTEAGEAEVKKKLNIKG
ncbi:MAG: hypothetical protein MUO19_02990 [Dehalococcoidales bacterium]|nr:hypothetical protein [Dehalococcoidales bacterium]